jgi:hypothetical protein
VDSRHPKGEVSICALDPEFVNDVGNDLEMPSLTDFRRIMNLRDRSLESIILLLAAEAQSGGPRLR